MGSTFLDFVNNRRQNTINKQILTESFKTKDFDKVSKLITEILKKHIKGLIPIAGYVETEIDGNQCISKQYMVVPDGKKPKVFQLNWRTDTKSVNVYSIDFFKNADIYWKGIGKTVLSIDTLGTSVAYFLPIIWTIVNSSNYSLSEKEALQVANSGFNESKLTIDNIEYHIYENIKSDIVYETFMMVVERENPTDDQKLINSLRKQTSGEYKGEVKLTIDRNRKVVEVPEESIKKLDDETKESGKKDPETTFKEMFQYIKMVTKGIQNSLIICGAPGVGKTWNVMRMLEKEGYVEDKNLCTMNSKGTPRKLYLNLYEFQKKGDIVIIDDCDAIIGPKASEDAINILKCALDSTKRKEGRLVTYGVAGPLKDDDGRNVPKKFYYNGSIIILTNYNAGSIDTALRSRSFVQDIHFSVEDNLKLIKSRLPDIKGDNCELSAHSKLRAYNFLKSLADEGADMEISFRTFGICAKLFMSLEIDPEMSKELVESMIREQMENQYDRVKSKY